MPNLLRRLIPTHNDRVLKRVVPLVEAANRFESELMKLRDSELTAKTSEFRGRLDNGEALDDLLPEAFAVVREAAKRTLGQRHYDVQLIGGIMLHRGNIAEMKTGEGKTLVSTLPTYLNALPGLGVHIVTVNDYLARRDAEWMGEIFGFLGMRTGVVVPNLSDPERQQAYAADITYATNNELGFDYLRDNMKFAVSHCVQRMLNYAIVDEVDSILIDEARTPLIISGPSEQNTQLYAHVNRVLPQLKAGEKGDHNEGIEETGDYWIDEKAHSATLTEAGVQKVETLLRVENLYDPEMLPVLHAVNQGLVAHTLKKRDVEYVVQQGEDGRNEVVIVDEFTGRLMQGRRWSDGLHQAVEAKEGIPVRSENQTLASVTFQNFFRLYEKISGMTGTADTEAPEFANIYDLDVMVIPTHRPMVRADHGDVVFKSQKEKFNAVVDEIKERHETGQPILVGTIAIETSEMLARKLAKRGVKHNVLNAKQHAREAEIVAQAGRYGAVTISTNMAGRGTDIVLGGNPEFLALEKCKHDKEHPDFPSALAHFEGTCAEERNQVMEAGGLHILGTERHESRRIDNQLRGRSGRQGDPGSTQFFLSLEDNLLRIFEGERVQQWWDRVGVEEGEAIENRLLTKVIENAQSKVEARNFDIRKHLLEYDDVMNRQRKAFYERRRDALSREDPHEEILAMTEGVIVGLLDIHWPDKGDPDPEQLAELATALHGQFGLAFDRDQAPFQVDGRPETDREAIGRTVLDTVAAALEEKKKLCDAKAEELSEIGYPRLVDFERDILLRILDTQWKDHLHTMDGLREGVSLRGYASRDPKLEYQREGYALFEEMNERIDSQGVDIVYKFSLPEPVSPTAAAAPRLRGSHSLEEVARERAVARGESPPQPGGAAQGSGSRQAKPGKVGRNDPCPCGSGKKHKKCCGAA
jgi:preprotein translocase subunit SecA